MISNTFITIVYDNKMITLEIIRYYELLSLNNKI